MSEEKYTQGSRYEIKNCSVPHHSLLVDAETSGSNFSLQMPTRRAKYICQCVNNYASVEKQRDDLLDVAKEFLPVMEYIALLDKKDLTIKNFIEKTNKAISEAQK